MDEAGWVSGADPRRMAEFVQGLAGPRRLRLFACACVRRVWHLLPGERSRAAVEVAERFADGAATEEELRRAEASADAAVRQRHTTGMPLMAAKMAAARKLPVAGVMAFASGPWVGPQLSGDRACVPILHDVFGNPFRPAVLDPRWLTANVVDLARTVYQEKAFDRLPVMADALMDAGCFDEAILGHCRSDGPHVRGCWVVDLLLGKE